MLRIGQSLSQSAEKSFHASCKVLPWSCFPCFQVSSQVRPKSHPAAQLPITKEGNATQNVSDEAEPSPDGAVPVSHWKRRFVRELKVNKYIPALRLPRAQPKTITSETHSSNGVPPIVIHPVHRSLLYRRTKPVTDSNPDSSLPPGGSSEASFELTEDSQSRGVLLQIISETQSPSEAWEAYSTLLSMHKSRIPSSGNLEGSTSHNGSTELTIPYPYLHRVARLLSATRPRTRTLFLHLLSVLTTLRSTGGPIFLWEWNALMDCAGKGWRKQNVQDYRAAISIFQDMVTSSQAGSSSSEPRHVPFQWKDMLPADSLPVEQPDIITFTTLLDIASRTSNSQAIQHATSLLAASELPWNNVTHMARLPYFIRTNQLRAVRGILLVSVTRGLDIITLNGCLWAYAHRGRLRVAMQVYRLLRQNIPAEDRVYFDESDHQPLSLDPQSYMGTNGQDENPILNIPGFIPQATMAPNAVTYTLLIQALCYHGDLINALIVFRDMVSTIDPAMRPLRSNKPSACYYKPTYAIYRAIFLGFARHANKEPPTLAVSLMSKQQGIDSMPLKEFAAQLTASDPKPPVSCPSPEELDTETPWTLENLEKIFDRFLEMDWEPGGRNAADVTAPLRPSGRMIYWIIAAYAKATKGDVRKMSDVWKQLDARFGYESDGARLGGRLGRIARELAGHQANNDDSL